MEKSDRSMSNDKSLDSSFSVDEFFDFAQSYAFDIQNRMSDRFQSQGKSLMPYNSLNGQISTNLTPPKKPLEREHGLQAPM